MEEEIELLVLRKRVAPSSVTCECLMRVDRLSLLLHIDIVNGRPSQVRVEATSRF